jgi:hypothetical protein
MLNVLLLNFSVPIVCVLLKITPTIYWSLFQSPHFSR